MVTVDNRFGDDLPITARVNSRSGSAYLAPDTTDVRSHAEGNGYLRAVYSRYGPGVLICSARSPRTRRRTAHCCRSPETATGENPGSDGRAMRYNAGSRRRPRPRPSSRIRQKRCPSAKAPRPPADRQAAPARYSPSRYSQGWKIEIIADPGRLDGRQADFRRYLFQGGAEGNAFS